MWDAIVSGLADGVQTYVTMAKIAGLIISAAIMEPF
jgi:hypothetical protein